VPRDQPKIAGSSARTRHGPIRRRSPTPQSAPGALGLALLLIASASLCGPAAAGATRAFDDSEIVMSHYPPWFKQSFLDLGMDLEEAVDEGKLGLLLFFETDGCAYCAAFIRDVFADPAIRARVRARFDVIGLDIFQDDELTDFQGRAMPVKVFARHEGAVASPTLIFYGPDGARMLRAVGYHPPHRFAAMLDYVVDGHHRTESLRSFLARRRAEAAPEAEMALIPDPLFTEPPYALDRRVPAERPLLVLFERRDCDACRQLHEHVLAHPPVRQLLQRFEVVRLDADDAQTPVLTPRGERSSPAGWTQALDLAATPAIVFFAEDGSEVLRFESLVLRQRMQRAAMYVLEGAYRDGTGFQRFTRAKSIERLGNE
jgi:thioredoxin-related protein